MENWTVKDVGHLVSVFVLGVVVVLILTLSLVHWNPARSYTPEQKILLALGSGSYWQKCGSGCEVAATSTGQATDILIDNGQLVMLVIPSLREDDKQVVTDLAGRKAWQWVGTVEKYLSEGGAGTEYIGYFGNYQLTALVNTKVDRTEIVFS